MKIKSIQITRKTEEIIKKYLYSGVYPSFRTITKELSLWLQDNHLGAPSFSHRSVNRKETTNPEKVNQNFREIEQDIRDVYEATIYQYNTIMKNHSQFEAERSMMRHEMDQLKNEIDQLLTITKETDVKYIQEEIIDFKDMTYVDAANTDTDIDAQKREVTLREKPLETNRIILSGDTAHVRVTDSYIKSSVVEPIRNAFDDKINTRWWHNASTRRLNTNNKMEISLIVPLPKEEAINTIEFIPHHSKEMYLSLEYSSDGGSSYTPIKNYSQMKVSSLIDVSFPTVRATHILFKLTKFEYDNRIEDRYNYSFGAKSIKIFKKEFEEESKLQTKLIQLPLNAKRVSFLIEDEISSGCDIEYEVCLNPDEDNNVWHRISSIDKEEDTERGGHSKSLLLDPNRRDTMLLTSARYNEEIINGMKSYKLYNSKGESYIYVKDYKGDVLIEDIEDPKLYRGINQIKREALYIPFKGDVPLMSDWEKVESEKKHLVKVDHFSKRNELNFHDGYDNMYRFTFCIYSEAARSVPISVNSVFKVLRNNILKAGVFSIYANKKRLIPSNDEVTVEMKPGWTEIQILIHLGNVIDRKDFDKSEGFPRAITLGKISIGEEKLFRAELAPLGYTDKDNLYHSISPHNKNYFAIKDREIFLNHDSKNTMFQLVYNQKKRTDVTSNIKIRARLIRNKNLSEITPKIRKIRIRTM